MESGCVKLAGKTDTGIVNISIELSRILFDESIILCNVYCYLCSNVCVNLQRVLHTAERGGVGSESRHTGSNVPNLTSQS